MSPIRGVGPRCDGGPFSADWSPLASAGTVTAAVLRWITLLSFGVTESTLSEDSGSGDGHNKRLDRWTGPVKW
ncbi:protein of unknown function [Streptomyces sp. KY75]|nr:protein of unknown function [Streptomyces sp. KY75]CAD5980867.1 protein of unknown function [Streptomyces sp. KY70]